MTGAKVDKVVGLQSQLYGLPNGAVGREFVSL